MPTGTSATTFDVADDDNLVVGMVVSGTGIVSGTAISGISSNTITIDTATNAIIATSETLTFRTVSAATTVSSISKLC